MIQDLAAATGATFWVLLAMALFMTVFGVVVVRLWRRDRTEIDRQSRLPLDDGEPPPARDGTDGDR